MLTHRQLNFVICAASLGMVGVVFAQPPAGASAAPSPAEMKTLNQALKTLMVQQDPGAQAIFDKHPSYNPIAAGGAPPFGRGGPGATPVPADQPMARTDQNSLLAHQQLLEKAAKGGIDIYFEGDSIVRRWGATDYPDNLANWNKNFFGWNAADFGWGADTLQNILWRLDNGELDGVNPKIIVLLGGTNNVGGFAAPGGDDAKATDIANGVKAVLDVMQKKAPNAVIIVTGITPRNDRGSTAVMPTINKINALIAKLADGKKIRYLNINDKLADPDGKLFPGMMNTGDQLHPTPQGYQVWADALKPIFTEILGPPAATDHAPPPTGDPSAVKANPSAQAATGR